MACGFYLSETVTLKEDMSTWLLPGGDQVSNYWVLKKKKKKDRPGASGSTLQREDFTVWCGIPD